MVPGYGWWEIAWVRQDAIIRFLRDMHLRCMEPFPDDAVVITLRGCQAPVVDFRIRDAIIQSSLIFTWQMTMRSLADGSGVSMICGTWPESGGLLALAGGAAAAAPSTSPPPLC